MRRRVWAAIAGIAVIACGRQFPRAGPPEQLHFVGEPDADLTVLRFVIVFGVCGYGRGGPRLADASVDEPSEAVTVTARLTRKRWVHFGNCPDIAKSIPVTVALRTHLGNRRILDGSCSPPRPPLGVRDERPACAPVATVAPPVGVGTWASIGPGPLAVRGEPKAVWTGREVLIVGGLAVERYAAYDDGAAYNPVTDQWRRIARRPVPGRILAAAWTGRELFAFGQTEGIGLEGARSAHMYDPTSDSWRETAPSPAAFAEVQASWTGHEVLLWGFGSGVMYDPAADSWRAVPPIDVPGAVTPGRGTWVDGVLAVQAGLSSDDGTMSDRLMQYDPRANRWRGSAPILKPFTSWGTLYPASGEGVVYLSGWSPRVLFSYSPSTDTWREIESPFADLEVHSHVVTGVPISGGRFVVRAGDEQRPLRILDTATSKWTYAAPVNGVLPGDGVLMWTGRDLLLWGRPSRGQPEPVNVAWRWTPPALDSPHA